MKFSKKRTKKISKRLTKKKVEKLLKLVRTITDLRFGSKKKYDFHTVILLGIFATMCGADSWQDYSDYGEVNKRWLKKLVNLPSGDIPCKDTFRRIISSVEPCEMNKLLFLIVKELDLTVQGHIALDGKRINGARDHKDHSSQAPTIVSAYSVHNRLVLSQSIVDKKSNENVAIKDIISTLALKGCVVTIDAAGTTRKIVEALVGKECDYVLALKMNQPTLFKKIVGLFELQDEEISAIPHHVEANKNRDRYERREVTVCDLSTLNIKTWDSAKQAIRIKAIRTINGKTSESTRYYITSLSLSAKELAKYVREHWHIENSLHWVLDVVFREDACKIRRKNAATNFATIRKFAINAFQNYPMYDSPKRAVSTRRKVKMAGWDHKFMLTVLLNDL